MKKEEIEKLMTYEKPPLEWILFTKKWFKSVKMKLYKNKRIKKLILICLLTAILGSLQAQNTISVIYHSTDMGLGLRYDRQIQKSGIYIALSKGNYIVGETERINSHIKAVAGYIKYMESKYNNSTHVYFSGGLSYHYYSNQVTWHPKIVYWPLSIDLGTGVKFKRVMTGFIFDFLKREGGVNFGINF